MFDGLECIVIAATAIAATTTPSGTRSLGLRSFALNICFQTLIKNFRERIHRNECAPTKDDFFLLGVQSHTAAADVTVRIRQTEQWRDIAIVGDAPHGYPTVPASADSAACFTAATTAASIAAAFTATTSAAAWGLV